MHIAQQCDGHDAVILKSQPGGEPISELRNGEVVTVLSWEGDHARVRKGDVDGYAKSTNILEVRHPKIAAQADGFHHVVMRGGLQHEKVAEVPNGEVVSLLEEDGENAKVRWRGEVGYVKAGNLVDPSTCPVKA